MHQQLFQKGFRGCSRQAGHADQFVETTVPLMVIAFSCHELHACVTGIPHMLRDEQRESRVVNFLTAQFLCFFLFFSSFFFFFFCDIWARHPRHPNTQNCPSQDMKRPLSTNLKFKDTSEERDSKIYSRQTFRSCSSLCRTSHKQNTLEKALWRVANKDTFDCPWP